MEDDPYVSEIETVSKEILRLTLEQGTADLDANAEILALQCKQEQLEYQQLKWQGASSRDVESKHRMLSETQKRWHQAEQIRKNKLLPLILRRLDDMESGASAVRDRANKPEFLAEDED